MKPVTKEEFFKAVNVGNVHPTPELSNNKLTGKSFWKRLDRNNTLIGISIDKGHENEADYFIN